MERGIVKMKDLALNQLLGSTARKRISIAQESSKYIYEEVSTIFRNGAAVYTAVVIARSTGRC
jgi:hypothetical protein